MTDDPRIDPADLRNVRFPGSSRRYDARSVDQFLETVAARIAATNVLVDELQAELDDARSAPTPPPPAAGPSDLSLLDDDDLVRLVGEETASVLTTARRAAEEIRSKAEEAAARMIREATVEADQRTTEAQERSVALTAEAEQALAAATADAESAAARIRQDAEADAERTTAESRARSEEQEAALAAQRAELEVEVEAVRDQAREEGRAMVAEAREVRTRILDDLQRRRDIARDHVERLIAGRERLLTAYAAVRENLDDITGELEGALPVPAEPDLPDGFAGAVGAEVDVDADAHAEVGTEIEVGAGPVEVDDTVAPPAEPEPADEAEPAEPEPADEADEPEPVVDGDVEDVVIEDATVAEVEPEPDVEPEPEAVDAEEPAPAVVDEPERTVAAAVEEDEPVELAPSEDDAEPPADGDEPVEVTTADAAEEEPGDVDALFARLRAEREESVARAQEVLGTEDEPVAEPAVEEALFPEPVAQAAAEEWVPAELLAPEAELTRRSEALTPLEAKLDRAIKRRLADEQNLLLDLLRRSGTTEPDELLPDADEQVAGYARIATKHLVAAAAAGGDGGAAPDIAELADGLGRGLVEPFRRRLARAAEDVDGDADELDERLRALYREWKVQHVAPAAADALLSAYARGALAAAGDGRVLWRIDPDQGPCPDAEDNALAGAVPAGEAFPTGDPCPQAHPGCRCLLVVER